MILVLLGTQKHKFERIIDYVLQYNDQHETTEDILIQAGENTYDINKYKKQGNVEVVNYISNYADVLNECDLVVCHGGVGIIMDALSHKKKVIAVARKKDLGEHIDDHQFEIVNKLCYENYIDCASSYTEFEKKVGPIFSKDFKEYVSNNAHFNEKLNNLLEDL